MKVVIPIETYKGVADGSSLTDERRQQILSVYEFVSSLGDEKLTYKSLQERVSLEDYGISSSAIRTFFPLLGKLGFVNYKDTFSACDLFTPIGKVFMETYKSLVAARELTPKNNLLIKELEKCLATTQRYGILLMNEQQEYSHHGIWLAIAILKREREIYWQEFLYFLYLLEVKGMSFDEAIAQVKSDRIRGVEYEYFNNEDNAIAGTSYSYTHSVLVEAGIVRDVEVNHSLLEDGLTDYLKLIDNYYE